MQCKWKMGLVAVSAALLSACGGGGDSSSLSFFVTSSNPGKGGDLGGLAGADSHCQQLAANVGAGFKTWKAYLSTTATDTAAAVNARDRIGHGPWVNAKGVTVATSVDDLHSANAKLGKTTSLTEKGEEVNGFGDNPNRHDILTGSRPDGTAFAPLAGTDRTCRNWTLGEGGSAIVGHHDHLGTNPDPVANASWNSSHGTRGCSLPQLAQSGSAGFFYCFAAN
ncbi:hypothetical protein [Comamonas humi]